MTHYYIKHHGPRVVVEPERMGVPGLQIMAEQALLQSERSLPPHFHRGVMEICYFVAGERLYHINGEMYMVGANQVFVTWPDEIHWVDSAPYGKASFYYLRIKLPARPRHFLGLDAEAAKTLIASLRNIPNRHFIVERKMRTMLKDAFGIAARPPTAKTSLELSLQMSNWLLQMCRYAEARPSGIQSADIAEAKRRIDADVRTVGTLADLAAVLGLSLSRFKNKFKPEVGLPPWEYILRRKILLAKELLTTKRRSITSLEMELGFASSQHFASTFRRFAGCTPTAYMHAGGAREIPSSYENADKWVDDGIVHGYVLRRRDGATRSP